MKTHIETVDIALNEDQIDIILTALHWVSVCECSVCKAKAEEVTGIFLEAQKGLREIAEENIRKFGEL